MKRTVPKNLATAALAALVIVMSIGCDDRASQIAQEAADRQADQNREIVSLNREVAAGTSRLVTEDAKSRQHALGVHKDLQGERASLNDGWNALETERKQLAQSRRSDSALAALVKGGGATVAAIIALSLAWLVLSRGAPADDASQAVYDAVIDNILDVPPAPTPLASPALRSVGSLPSSGDADVQTLTTED